MATSSPRVDVSDEKQPFQPPQQNASRLGHCWKQCTETCSSLVDTAEKRRTALFVVYLLVVVIAAIVLSKLPAHALSQQGRIVAGVVIVVTLPIGIMLSYIVCGSKFLVAASKNIEFLEELITKLNPHGLYKTSEHPVTAEEILRNPRNYTTITKSTRGTALTETFLLKVTTDLSEDSPPVHVIEVSKDSAGTVTLVCHTGLNEIDHDFSKQISSEISNQRTSFILADYRSAPAYLYLQQLFSDSAGKYKLMAAT